MDKFFIRGFEKVAVSANTVRKAYQKALKRAAELKKQSPAPFDEIKKLEDKASFFGKGMDKKLKASRKSRSFRQRDIKDKLKDAYQIRGSEPRRLSSKGIYTRKAS